MSTETTTTTAIENIMRRADFDHRVAALKDSAGEFGDPEQVAICLIAEEGEPEEGAADRFCGLALSRRELDRLDAMTQDEARRECARVLLDAEAQR